MKMSILRRVMGNYVGQLWSAFASLMFFWAMFQQFMPDQVQAIVKRRIRKILNIFSPYMHVTFPEHAGNDQFRRSEAFSLVETYLGSRFATSQARRLRADYVKNSQSLALTLDNYEEVTETFQGAKLWWSSTVSVPRTTTISLYQSNSDNRRSFRLTFHHCYRDIITKEYLNHVLKEARAARLRNRQRKLFTNGAGGSWNGYNKSKWCHVVFEHPATFDTLAMDPEKKQAIINDLQTFTKARDYYSKIGKTWKRGYLLYGPPGTGKSTMIAAMANLLSYDVYDLELTAVKNNTELRRLLIDTTSKSIIVVEDIDCSLDLTGQRKKTTKQPEPGSEVKPETAVADPVKAEKDKESDGSKVTLSGILNSIDGLWSACEGERLIVFTTNFVDKLDPALTRRGRMDLHIEMSYCRFEAFKVLVKNYWDISEHRHFDHIGKLMEEVDMTPADVSENLMPKSSEDTADTCLANLIKALETTKEASKLKTETEQGSHSLPEKNTIEESSTVNTGIIGQVPEDAEDAKQVLLVRPENAE